MASSSNPSAALHGANIDAEPSAAFTPGPWEASGGGYLWGIWFNDGKARLASIDRSRDGHQPFANAAEADARLIAAAPDLLLVAQITGAFIGGMATVIRADGPQGARDEGILALDVSIRAAIAKALGDDPKADTTEPQVSPGTDPK